MLSPSLSTVSIQEAIQGGTIEEYVVELATREARERDLQKALDAMVPMSGSDEFDRAFDQIIMA